LTFIDLFSGVGGFRAGLEEAGWACLGHCEIDKFANAAYNAIFEPKEGEWYADDITKIRPEQLPECDLITAGFPCQDISIAGRVAGLDGARSSLFFEVVRLIKGKAAEARPRWLLFENVKNLLSVSGTRDFATILCALAEIGYDVRYKVFNTKDYGIPQNRERVYILCERSDAKGCPRTGSGREILPERKPDAETSVRCSELQQILGGQQGKRVYSDSGISCTLTSGGGGFAGNTGLYATANCHGESFIDLSKDTKHITTVSRCIKARYDSGIGNRAGENSGVLNCSCQRLVDICKGGGKITENARCLVAKYFNGITNRAEQSGVLCSAVLTPDREHTRQNGRRIKKPNEAMFTLTANDKHGVYLCNRDEQPLLIKEATAKGYKEAHEGDGVNFAYPSSKLRRGRVGEKCVNTITATPSQGTVCYGRIRKLTPKECFRLQGFSDEMFEKAKSVCSDSRLYKLAGNAVSVNVVYAIGRAILAEGDEF
jgi:DNA-methyltransferase (dcm)